MAERRFKFAAETTDHRSVSAPPPSFLETAMSLHDPRHYVRRVVLPSGKTIEVVYFEDQAAAATAPVTASAAPAHDESVQDLHVCAPCHSGLVYPTEWEEAGATHWE